MDVATSTLFLYFMGKLEDEVMYIFMLMFMIKLKEKHCFATARAFKWVIAKGR